MWSDDVHESGTALAEGMGVPCLEKTAKDPDGGPYPMYPNGKSWDEIPDKMSSRKKFFHNAISGADFAAQPYYVATRGL